MKPSAIATFKALLRYDGTMVAAVAAVAGGATRFFIMQLKETPELFISRVSQWIKERGGTGLEMQEPQVLAEGIEVGEVLLRIKNALGIDRSAPEQSAYDIPRAELVWQDGSPRDKTN
jgi:hypothetical protein